MYVRKYVCMYVCVCVCVCVCMETVAHFLQVTSNGFPGFDKPSSVEQVVI